MHISRHACGQDNWCPTALDSCRQLAWHVNEPLGGCHRPARHSGHHRTPHERLALNWVEHFHKNCELPTGRTGAPREQCSSYACHPSGHLHRPCQPHPNTVWESSACLKGIGACDHQVQDDAAAPDIHQLAVIAGGILGHEDLCGHRQDSMSACLRAGGSLGQEDLFRYT